MEDALFVKTGHYFEPVHLDEIMFIEGSRKYARIVTEKKTYLVHLSLSYLEDFFSTNHFCRIHKSYIVSLQFIRRFDRKSVRIGDKHLPIGRHYKKIFQGKVSFLHEELKKIPIHFGEEGDDLRREIQ